MKLRIKFADKIVGFFILFSIIGLAVVLILLGMNQRWFRKDVHFFTEFNSGSGLKVGMPINLKGFEIGKLDKLNLDAKTRRVRVDFHIYSEYYQDIALQNSVIELASSPIGLGSSLLFHPGKSGVTFPDITPPPLEEGDFIPSTDFKEGVDLVRKGLVDRSSGEDSIGALLAEIKPIIEQVKNIVPSINAILLLVEEGLKGQTKENEIGAILVNIDKMLKDNGPLGQSLENISKITLTLSKEIEQMALSLKTSLGSIEKLTKSIEDPTGLVPRLLDPKGSIKTLLDDNNVLYNEILSIIANFDGIITQLNGFTRFLNNTQPQISGLLDETNKALDNAQDVMEGLKNNPLLRGGIPEKREQPTTIQSFRGDEF
jgi:phospholipid/cholesterol/gamma-HCH transport system substrate-binding protein